MEMSTSQQEAQKAQEQMKQGAQQTKEEAKDVTRESIGAAKKGYEELKHEKRPMSAAMTAVENAPKPLWMGLAAGSIVASLLLYGFRKKEDAIFIGHWAPTFLALGLFSKLVGRQGSEDI